MMDPIFIAISMTLWSLILLAHGIEGLLRGKNRFLFKRAVEYTASRAYIYSAITTFSGFVVAMALVSFILSGLFSNPSSRDISKFNNMASITGLVSFGITIVAGIVCGLWEGRVVTKT